MDIFQAAEKYIVEMTTRKVGMKALLLDEYTVCLRHTRSCLCCSSSNYFLHDDLADAIAQQTAPVSMVYSHSDVLQNEIYLLSTITDRSNSSETFDDVDAIVFVRPCRNRFSGVFWHATQSHIQLTPHVWTLAV